MEKIYKVGIIGGGISGVVTALQLANCGIHSVLFEQKESVVNGPPFCHLHAGGNLYPDISDEQCRILMKQSIEMARLFPHSIDKRPTFISIPKSEKYKPEDLKKRMEMLELYYRELIGEDSENEVLGSANKYYKLYAKEDLVNLEKQAYVKQPSTHDEWMLNAIKLIDYEKLKTPVFMVQEYGWNLFRLAAQAQLALNQADKCNLKLNTKVINIKDVRNKNLDYNWEIFTDDASYKVKYLVNSCGFNTNKFDDNLRISTEQLIEFKAAYVSKWQTIPGLIPELIFHGERGTPNGMVQLTPYSNNYYQIHGMTKDVTLFENGLVKIKNQKVRSEFSDSIKQKLDCGWEENEVNSRTEKAIEMVAKFVLQFDSAKVGGPPLYGAQQIPGTDLNLRVGEVSFPSSFYARSEIVKASSAYTVANQIINKIQDEGIVPKIQKMPEQNELLNGILKQEIDKMADEIAIKRGYPEALSKLLIEKKS